MNLLMISDPPGSGYGTQTENILLELKKHNISRYRHLFFGLAFLYSSGIIDFKEPFIYIKNKND